MQITSTVVDLFSQTTLITHSHGFSSNVTKIRIVPTALECHYYQQIAACVQLHMCVQNLYMYYRTATQVVINPCLISI